MAKDRMLCFLCGKKIGLLRALFDQQYCSVEHRKEARLAATSSLEIVSLLPKVGLGDAI